MISYRGDNVSSYKKMYLELFNAVTDAIETLQEAQRSVENIYMGSLQGLELVFPHDEDSDSDQEISPTLELLHQHCQLIGGCGGILKGESAGGDEPPYNQTT